MQVEITATALGTFLAFSAIAGLTWFCSTRPRFLVRFLCPPDERFATYRAFLKDRHTGRAMRVIAVIQFVAGAIVAVLIAISN
jgi:hypothetical protein